MMKAKEKATVKLEQSDGGYTIWMGEQAIGRAELYENPCHRKNCYVKLELSRLDPEISGPLFRKLQEIAMRPLQVMTESSNTALIAFLTAGGFVRKRKCYEVEAGKSDYIGGKSKVQLIHSHSGEPDYERCVQRLFDSYVETHKAVNPWTADYEAFLRNMPEDVVFADGGLSGLAFVEGNEIAYVCGSDKQRFPEFLRSLVTEMFQRYETICFESDDCDWAAMELKTLFRLREEGSFDTYVYDTGGFTVPE